jgi:hypothetical protein
MKGLGINVVEDDLATLQCFALEDAAQRAEAEGSAACADQDNLGVHDILFVPT